MEQAEETISMSEFITREILLLQQFSLQASDDLKTMSLNETEWIEQLELFIENKLATSPR